ncbi:hypothetical protein [Streptomyces sp. NBC_00658]
MAISTHSLLLLALSLQPLLNQRISGVATRTSTWSTPTRHPAPAV